MENGGHDTENNAGERCDNFDIITLGITDRREGERYYFVGLSYNNTLGFIGSFDVVYIVGLRNKSLIFYWRSKRDKIENVGICHFLVQAI